MIPALEYPSPRDELDSGSVSELVEESRALVVPRTALPVGQPRRVEVRVDIDVPEDAVRLIQGFGDYGS